MGIGFQNPTAQTFESFDAWSQWLEQQPKDVQEAFSGLEGAVHVPSRERFDEIIAKVKSYQIFLQAQSQTQNVGWGGSGLFVSNAKTAMQQAVTQSQTGQVKSFSKPQFALAEPVQDPSAQCERLRNQILPIYQDCLDNAQTAVTRQNLDIGGPEGTVIRPATLSLFGSYVAALVDDCGLARGGGNVRTEALIQNLKKYCGPDTVAHADAILKNFKTVTYKTSDGSEIPLEQLIKNNLSRFQRALQMDTSKAVVTGMQGLPNNVMLVLEDLVQRGENHILNQLQAIDNGSAMTQIAGKMEDYNTQIKAAIKTIKKATDQDDVFALIDLFPNEQAQAYLYAQIGIDQRLLKLKSKPPQVSDEQWEFHQNFKEAKSNYEVKGMVVSGVTAAGMIFGAGIAGLFPPLAPFLLAGMATMTVGFAVHDVNSAEDKYTLSDVSHLASQKDGNPVLAEEEDVYQAEQNVNHAVAKAPAEVVLAVAGMGTAMRIHQSTKLTTGAKILLDMGAGGTEAALATSANWQHYDEGTMGQQMKMSFVFGLGGSLVGEGFSRGLKYGVKGTRFDYSPKVDADDSVDDINDVTDFLIEEKPDIQVVDRRLSYETEVTESDLTDPIVDRLYRDDFVTQDLPEDQVIVEVNDPRLLDGLDGVEATRDAPINANLRDELFDFSSRGLTDRLQEIHQIADYSTLRKKIAECKQALAYGAKNNLLTRELPFDGESNYYLEHWTQLAYALRRQGLALEDSGQLSAQQAKIVDESLFGLEKSLVTAQQKAAQQANQERNLYPENPVTLEHGLGDRYKPQSEDKLEFDDLTDGFVFHRPDHNTKPTSDKLPSVLNEISKLQPGEIQNHIDQTYLVFRDVLDFHDGRIPVLMDQFAYGPFPLRTFTDFQQCYVTYRRLLQRYKDNGQIDPQAYDQAVTSLKHLLEDVTDAKVEDFVAGEDGKHAPDVSKHLEEEIDDVSDLLELEEPMPDLSDDLIAENPAIKVEDNRDDLILDDPLPQEERADAVKRFDMSGDKPVELDLHPKRADQGIEEPVVKEATDDAVAKNDAKDPSETKLMGITYQAEPQELSPALRNNIESLAPHQQTIFSLRDVLGEDLQVPNERLGMIYRLGPEVSSYCLQNLSGEPATITRLNGDKVVFKSETTAYLQEGDVIEFSGGVKLKFDVPEPKPPVAISRRIKPFPDDKDGTEFFRIDREVTDSLIEKDFPKESVIELYEDPNDSVSRSWKVIGYSGENVILSTTKKGQPVNRVYNVDKLRVIKKIQDDFPMGREVRVFDDDGDLNPYKWYVTGYMEGDVILSRPALGIPETKVRDANVLRASQRKDKKQRLADSSAKLVELMQDQIDEGFTIPVTCVLPNGYEVHNARVLQVNLHENKALIQTAEGHKMWVDSDSVLPEQSLLTSTSQILDNAATGMLRIAREQVAIRRSSVTDDQWNRLYTGDKVQQGQDDNCFLVGAQKAFEINKNFHAVARSSIEVKEDVSGNVIEYSIKVPMGSRDGRKITMTPDDLKRSTIRGDDIYKIMEFAYVTLESEKQGFEKADYSILDGGGFSIDVFEALFGKYFKSIQPVFGFGKDQSKSFKDMGNSHPSRNALRILGAFDPKKHMWTLQTKEGPQGEKDDVVFDIHHGSKTYSFYYLHAYTITGVTKTINGEIKTVTVNNPHDTSKPMKLPYDVFLDAFNLLSGGKFRDNILFTHLEAPQVDQLAAK